MSKSMFTFGMLYTVIALVGGIYGCSKQPVQPPAKPVVEQGQVKLEEPAAIPGQGNKALQLENERLTAEIAAMHQMNMELQKENAALHTKYNDLFAKHLELIKDLLKVARTSKPQPIRNKGLFGGGGGNSLVEPW